MEPEQRPKKDISRIIAEDGDLILEALLLNDLLKESLDPSLLTGEGPKDKPLLASRWHIYFRKSVRSRVTKKSAIPMKSTKKTDTSRTAAVPPRIASRPGHATRSISARTSFNAVIPFFHMIT